MYHFVVHFVEALCVDVSSITKVVTDGTHGRAHDSTLKEAEGTGSTVGCLGGSSIGHDDLYLVSDCYEAEMVFGFCFCLSC